jgi:hypothetical protein
MELNELSVLEAQQLHAKYEAAKADVKKAVETYKAALSANDCHKRADDSLDISIRTLLEQHKQKLELKLQQQLQMQMQQQSHEQQNQQAVHCHSLQNQSNKLAQRTDRDHQHQHKHPDESKQVLSRDETKMTLWKLRTLPRFGLSRSLRKLAQRIVDSEEIADVLRDRLRVLLALRDGAEPHESYPPACMTLHTACVESSNGFGIAELRQYLHRTCMQQKFMGELLPQTWLKVARALPALGDGVLSQQDAVASVRFNLAAASVALECTDEELWRVLRFWSRVGDIFV